MQGVPVKIKFHSNLSGRKQAPSGFESETETAINVFALFRMVNEYIFNEHIIKIHFTVFYIQRYNLPQFLTAEGAPGVT